MKSFFKIFKFIIYMIFHTGKQIKLSWLKKHSSDKEVEDYIFESVSEWARFTTNNFGIKVNLYGLNNLPESNCLIVANHQSDFDIPVLLSYIPKPIGFVAKKQLANIPVISYWMRAIKCVFLDRENVRASIKAINEAVDNLKGGYSMVIFPEGTRSRSRELGEFKKGSLKLALKSKVPIVPITIDGTYKAFEGNEGNKFKDAEVNIIISKPIIIEELSKEEKSNLSEITRDIIKNNLKN